MSGDSIFALCVALAAIFFFLGYFCGRSDQRDAEHRARIVENMKPGNR